MVGRRARCLLGLALGLLRDQGARAVRARAHLTRASGSRMVPGCASQLRGAHARAPRGRGLGGDRRRFTDTRTNRAELRGVARPGRARSGRTPPAGRRAGRPRRRLPAEHPRDDRRVPRNGQSGGDLGDVPTGVRRAERPAPARPALTDRPAGRRRLPLRRQARRPAQRGRVDARTAVFAAHGCPRPLRRW